MTVLPIEPDPTPEPFYQRLEGFPGLIPLRVKFITKEVDYENVRLAEERADREGTVCWAEGVFTNLTKTA